MEDFDVIIIGGGIIGSSVACFLSAQPDFQGSIAVIEPDSTYQFSSTALSVGGIRQQFSTPENIQMSKFAVEFIANIDEYLTVDGYNPEVQFVQNGYLTLASEMGYNNLTDNFNIQVEQGADVILYSAEELKLKFPYLSTDDLSGGVFGLSGEGWIDPNSLLKRFINKARSHGVQFISSRVINLKRGESRIEKVILENRQEIGCGWVVNAAGPKAASIAKMAGISDFPVFSRKRMVYVFRSHIKLPDAPLVIDPSGVYFRPEGNQFLCGVSPSPEDDLDTEDLNPDHQLFESVIWPVLAKRVEAFDAIRLENSWAGHYAYNSRDQNVILGPHHEVTNLLFANGFSGHGLQQAPAVGRAISELIAFGHYRTLNLSRLNYTRLSTENLIQEKQVV